MLLAKIDRQHLGGTIHRNCTRQHKWEREKKRKREQSAECRVQSEAFTRHERAAALGWTAAGSGGIGDSGGFMRVCGNGR